MIYLYALTEAAGGTPECKGIEEARVQGVETGGLSAVYSAHRTLDCTPRAEALWRHDEVVEAAMRSGPTLPVRFGTTFDEIDPMLDVLARESATLRAQLERVRGCVELAVRVSVPAPEADDALDGRAYLESRLEGHRLREAVAQRALAPLAELAVSARERETGAPGVIAASFLVRGGEIDAFAEEVRSLQQTEPSLSCTGPWAPYSFVDGEDLA